MKMHLNMILYNGVDGLNEDTISSMHELHTKLSQMNLSLIAQLLGEYLETVEKMRENVNYRSELRNKAVVTTFKILVVTRMFERTMTLELTKKKLLEKEVE